MSKEYKIELPSGNFIAYGTDNKEVQPSYIRFIDGGSEDELYYWDRQEWLEDPECVVGAIMGALYGLSYPEENETHEGLTMDDLHEGAEVYWNDPEGTDSGYYEVTELYPQEDMVTITHPKTAGSFDAFVSELS